jgi:fumarate hydratase, class II
MASDPNPMRIEHDSLGEVAVPADALYGAQTQRAVDNFPVSGRPMPEAFVRALLLVKAAAARANVRLDVLPADAGAAIAAAALELQSQPGLAVQFPIDVFQTGSGTSSNMNANEVLATLATRRLGRAVHPNDDVNCSQSSNDTIPTALHVAAVLALGTLQQALQHLADTTRRKASGLHAHVKTGRTHLMDAMPVRLSQVLEGWATQVDFGLQQLLHARHGVLRLAQGGTAVGTGVNAPAGFVAAFHAELTELTGQHFEPAPSFFAAMGGQEAAVALSGACKTCAVALTKVANDLRWMNSGPLAGLAEIELEALQPGSSIMPGKVNPVIPESVAMVCAQVIGNDTAVTLAGQSGNFELNVMLPLIARNLLESLELLANASRLLADKAIAGFKVNEAQLQRSLARNPILVTALNPVIGYAKAAEIAKQAYREDRPILDVALEQTELGRERLAQLLDPARLTEGGL